MAQAENLIGQSGLPPFFRVANPGDLGLEAPDIRKGRGEALRAHVRSLAGFQKEALVASARTGHVWRLVSDEGAYLNGHDAAPCPLSFLTAGMIASYMQEFVALAAKHGVRVDGLKMVQNNYYTMKGAMRDRSMTGGALPVELEVEVASDADAARLNQIAMDAVHASPLNGLMRGVLPSLFALSKNGAPLAPGRAQPLPGGLLPEPGATVRKALPVESPLTLIERTGMTEPREMAGATKGGGSSLTDHQDRVLNPAATARIEDGLVVIDQRLYSPLGSTFRYLSSEDGRAPDAATLISAGIAFCFMTQFGRFAAMEKLDLPSYAVLQDTHFSLGGGTGGTGRAGEADPVETHVYLTTTEPDEVAREMLDISEQTCFLHAFCRTDLKTRLSVRRAA